MAETQRWEFCALKKKKDKAEQTSFCLPIAGQSWFLCTSVTCWSSQFKGMGRGSWAEKVTSVTFECRFQSSPIKSVCLFQLELKLLNLQSQRLSDQSCKWTGQIVSKRPGTLLHIILKWSGQRDVRALCPSTKAALGYSPLGHSLCARKFRQVC